MGWRFRKRIKVFGLFWINIGKKGVTGVSTGPRGLTTTWNFKKGVTTTATVLPGTGLSYAHKWGAEQMGHQPPPLPGGQTPPPLPPRRKLNWQELCDECEELGLQLRAANAESDRSRQLEVLQAILRNTQESAIYCAHHGAPKGAKDFRESAKEWEDIIRDHIKRTEEMEARKRQAAE